MITITRQNRVQFNSSKLMSAYANVMDIEHLALIEKKKNGCCAWDKALFFFNRLNVSHENVWFIEDDVFVPRPSVISKIDQTHQKADVVSTDFHVKRVGEEDKWYWWKYVPSQLVPEPWAHSMACAIRLSRGMLNIFDYFVQRNKITLPSINIMQKIIRQDYIRRMYAPRKAFFHEYIFHTLALHNNLIIATAKEMQGIVWRHNWDISEMNVETLYHPIKEVAIQTVYRRILECGEGPG